MTNTLNIKNIKIMQDTFKRLVAGLIDGRGFNMKTESFTDGETCIKHGCGTAACFMGWSHSLFDSVFLEDSFSIFSNMSKIIMPHLSLKLNYKDTPEIFTLEAAITVLQILIDEGEAALADDVPHIWQRAIDNPWSPDENKFVAKDWLNSMVDPDFSDVEIPIIEGPKKVKS